MNPLGWQAMDHWRRFLPERFEGIADPEAYFTDLGEQAQERVDELMLALAGDDPPGEGYLAKLGRLNMARMQALERVRAEMILIDPEAVEVGQDDVDL